MEELFSPNKAGPSKVNGTKSKTTFYSELSFEDDFNPANNSKNEEQLKPFSPPSVSVQASGLSPILENAHASPLMCYVVRLKHGEELRKTLLSFAQKHGLKAAFVMSCVGSATSAKIRTANATPNTEAHYMLDIVNPTEIVSLEGTLSGGGHLHVALSDAAGKMLGGHLLELTVDTTAEIVIGDCSALAFLRNFDKTTGFNELSVNIR